MLNPQELILAHTGYSSPQELHSSPQKLHSGPQGLHSSPQGLHYSDQGLHYSAQSQATGGDRGACRGAAADAWSSVVPRLRKCTRHERHNYAI